VRQPKAWETTANDLAEAILPTLNERPFSLRKLLCQHFRFAKTSCLRILHDSLGMKNCNLHRGLYALGMSHKSEQVTLSPELVVMIQSDCSSDF
jgi:hypothetical protein